MTDDRHEEVGMPKGGLKYALPQVAEAAETLSFSEAELAQRGARHCASPTDSELGEPMTIREVARMFGCSEWTIRQQYLPKGLPYFRLSRQGKLLFFHNQIVRWVLEKQRQKGGMIR
jgi:hypothetical protein